MTQGSMANVGVIVNPRSHGAQIEAVRQEAARHPGVRLAEPLSHHALAATLQDFHVQRIDLLVIYGGDGTLRDVLSALPAASYGDAPPRLALVRGGNTSLAARAMGGIGAEPAGLRRLLQTAAAGQLRRTSCPVLEVAWPAEPNRPALRGLLFGAAGFAEGKRIADTKIHRRGAYKRLAVGLAVALTMLRGLAGNSALRRGTSLTFGADDTPSLTGPRLLFLATTLDRLILGLWPFRGSGPGHISWLDIDAPPVRLGQALAATLLHLPARYMPDHGYRSGRGMHLHLKLAGPFVLDGEFFEPGAAGITLSCPATIVFVRP